MKDCVASLSCGPLSLQNETEAAALLPVFLDWSGRVVRVVVHKGRVHSPRVAVGAVPPVVCNQRKLQPHALTFHSLLRFPKRCILSEHGMGNLRPPDLKLQRYPHEPTISKPLINIWFLIHGTEKALQSRKWGGSEFYRAQSFLKSLE